LYNITNTSKQTQTKPKFNKNWRLISKRNKFNKILGVKIDKSLSWNLHIDRLCKKLRPMIGMLFKCSSFLPRKVLIVIYNSFMNSKINYCLESAKSYINQIHLLQKRLVRIIYEKSPLTHTKPLFLHSLILPV